MPIDVVSDITAGAWKSLGGELHVLWNRIEVVDIDQYTMERKRQAVLRAWYEAREEAYWEKIVESLKRMEQRRLANRIAARKGRRFVKVSSDKHASADSTSTSQVHTNTSEGGQGHSNHSTSRKTPSQVHTATSNGGQGHSNHSTSRKPPSRDSKEGHGNGSDTSWNKSATHVHTTTLDDGLDNSGHSDTACTLEQCKCREDVPTQDSKTPRQGDVQTQDSKTPCQGDVQTQDSKTPCQGDVQTQDSKTPSLVLDQQENNHLMRYVESLHINVVPELPQNQQNDLRQDACSFSLFFLRVLLLLGGDIERNPGPDSKHLLSLAISFGHWTFYHILLF